MTHNEFREAGYRVFGLYGADADNNCACGNPTCPAAYKHPIAANWQHTPVWSDEQWETCHLMGQFNTGYGVMMRGLCVIDIDARNGGVASYETLLKEFPDVAGCTFIVRTGSGEGSKHLYFKAPEGNPAMVANLERFKGIDFKSSGYVVGPGSMHKSGNRYEVAFGSVDDIDDMPPALVEELTKPEHFRAEINGQFEDISAEDIADILASIPNDNCNYEDWLRVGMGIHHATGGTGYDLWVVWSQQSAKHDAGSMEYKWHSFGKSINPVTLGTVIHMAEQNGWVRSVTFDGDGQSLAFNAPEQAQAATGDLIDTSGIDLNRPPGFVGDVTAWINTQCRRPREKLAVAGALVAVGNVIGLKYIDEKDGVTSNMFAFCVAGSRTGKEAIHQSIETIHRVAGIAGAAHGSMKSEQEIMRNLIDHQSCIYDVDEIGDLLRKIKNAQSSGGASYLEGIIGLLMSAYSKTNGYLKPTGDLGRDLKTELRKKLAALTKILDEREDDKAEQARVRLEAQLNNIDNGLEKPFLSLIGFTTPVTFDALVDYSAATNGFFGRSLVFTEQDTAPRRKKRFRAPDMPQVLEHTLMRLAQDGTYSTEGRIEHYGKRNEIPTEEPAADMLEDIADRFDDNAVTHKERTGLEALYLGAYELVSKVSFILAAPSGLRTSEHVLWAYALVCRDIEEKMHRVVANDKVKDDPLAALRSRIMVLVGDEDGESEGVLLNRIRNFKGADVKQALLGMVENGILITEESKPKNGGKLHKRFKKASI